MLPPGTICGDDTHNYQAPQAWRTLVMTWIVISLILLAAFGPVLWLVPSKRDRHLTALRDQARREGLVVELRRLPKLNPSASDRVSAGGRIKNPKVECAAYSRTLGKRLVNISGWRLLRGNGEPQVLPGWEFDPELRPNLDSGRDVFDASLKKLSGLFEALPGDMIGVELSPRSLTLYWLEGRTAQRSTVTALNALLAVAEGDLAGVDEQFRSNTDDEDS
jgi:hypothetical protein